MWCLPFRLVLIRMLPGYIPMQYGSFARYGRVVFSPRLILPGWVLGKAL